MEETLRQISIFSELSPASLSKLEHQGEFTEVQSGYEIATPSNTIFIIKEGSVNCFIRDASDKRFLLGTLNVGDVLGELSHLSPEGSHDQKVELQAAGPVTCFRVNTETFFEVVWHEPKAAMQLSQLLARRLSAMNAFVKQVVDVDIDPAVIQGRTIGEKLADIISAWLGSWYFLAGGAVFVVLWMIINVIGWMGDFDPFPFIFLNLVFSIISAATIPVLLISQNRQNQLDRMAARVNHRVTLRGTQLLGSILKRIADLETRLEQSK